MTVFNRRSFLKVSSGLALSPMLARSAFAAEDPIVIGTWGGDYQALLGSEIAEPLMKPAHEVSFLTGDANSRMTKLRAEKTARRPSMDIACLSDPDMYAMNAAGTLARFTPALLKNGGSILDPFRKTYAMPHMFSGLVIIYNTEFVKTPPDSFAATLDPKYKGKVGLSEAIYQYNGMIGAQAAGKNASDLAAGAAFLKELKPNQPRVYPSNEAVAGALKSGEIWITCMWKARALQWKDAGVPVDFVVPKEGAIPAVFEAAIPLNNRKPDPAYAFLNFMLDSRVQLAFAKKMGYAPTTSNAGLPEDLQARVGFTPAQIEKFVKIDYERLTLERATFLEYWSKDFKVGL